MDVDRTCPECGRRLPPGASELLCPICALREAAASTGTDTGASQPLNRQHSSLNSKVAADSFLTGEFGDYQLLEEIARGGMGVVYKARQKSLNRLVALKMVLGGPLASAAARQRFRAEAQAAACLQHPHIIAIHEVGEVDGQPFFSMDYVEGPNLATLLRGGPLQPGRAAAYAKTIAEAVAYAHQKGILHRDLKPSNVLIDPLDQPRVTDFGLAKQLTGGSDLTMSGQVLGSPNFMAPEQAQGRHREVGPASDVYSLGALLYHLITGRPPFQAATLTEVLRQVASTDPAPPRLLNPGIPRDLETICLKCLEKEPLRRCATARELAEELARFQAGEPIRARPLSTADKLGRWCRRNPALAGTGAVAVLALVLGFSGVLWQLQRARAAEFLARHGQYISDMNLAQQALKANSLAGARELLNHYQPRDSETDLRGVEWRYLWQECQIPAEEIGWLDGPIRSLEVSPDGKWLAAGSDPGSVRLWNLQTSESFRLTGDGGVKAFLTFSPDSRLLLFTDQSFKSLGTIAVWDIRKRQLLAPIKDRAAVGTMAFSPDGKWFGYGMVCGFYDRKLVLIDFFTRQKLREVTTVTGFQDIRHGLGWLFTADGRRAIYSENEPCGSIVSYDFLSGSPPRHFPEFFPLTEANLVNLPSLTIKLRQAARPFDAWLTARLSPETKALLRRQDSDLASLGAVLLQDLNRILAGAEIAENASLFSGIDLRSQTRALLALNPIGAHRERLKRLLLEDAYSLEISENPFPGHREAIVAMAMHPGGRMLATGAGFSDRTIRLWDLPSFRASGELDGHHGWITALRFSHDGQILASAGADRSIRFWDTRTRRQRTVFERLPEIGWCLCFAPNGRTLFCGADDGWIHRWSVEVPPAHPQPWRSEARLHSLTVALAGNQFAGLRHGVAWMGEVGSDMELRPIVALGTNLTCLLLSPNGEVLFAGAKSGEVQAWSVDKGKVLRHLPGPAEPVRTLEQDRRGRVLLVVHEMTPKIESEGLIGVSRIRAWRTTDWQVQQEWDLPGLSSAAVSPDGRYCAVGQADGEVRLWNLTGGSKPDVSQFSRTIRGLAFSPDGRLLAASSAEGYLRTWDLVGLKPSREFRVPSSARDSMTVGNELCFSPDGRSLAMVGEGEEALKLLDVVTWRELISLSLSGESLREIFFSADGHRLTALNSQGDVLSWWMPSFEEIAERENQRALLK